MFLRSILIALSSVVLSLVFVGCADDSPKSNPPGIETPKEVKKDPVSEEVPVLENAWSDIEYDLLVSAIVNGGIEDMRKLIEKYKIDLNQVGSDGFAPLHHAVLTGDFEKVRFLLDTGADINVRSRDKLETALTLSVKNEHQKISGLLAYGKADTMLYNSDEETAYTLAAKKLDVKTLESLRKNHHLSAADLNKGSLLPDHQRYMIPLWHEMEALEVAAGEDRESEAARLLLQWSFWRVSDGLKNAEAGMRAVRAFLFFDVFDQDPVEDSRYKEMILEYNGKIADHQKNSLKHDNPVVAREAAVQSMAIIDEAIARIYWARESFSKFIRYNGAYELLQKNHDLSIWGEPIRADQMIILNGTAWKVIEQTDADLERYLTMKLKLKKSIEKAETELAKLDQE